MFLLQILLILSHLRIRPIDFLIQQNQEQLLTLAYTLCQCLCFTFLFLFGILEHSEISRLLCFHLPLNSHAEVGSFFPSSLVFYVPAILCHLLHIYNLYHILPLIRL